jgi:CubicO group peptidase (beta-lactamase class C family)
VAVTQHLPRSAPEAQGIPSSAILGFVEEAERQIDALHSVMLVRHGHVVAEGWWAPYSADKPHMFYSLSKSFTSTAIGLAVAEGLLSLDDTVISFFPDDLPAEVSENLAAMRVRHLLAMATGHGTDTTPFLHGSPDGNWARAFLARPVEHPPGTHFNYNTGATYMLSAILQGLTGITLLEYLQPRLLTPLGIEGATWESCPRGINTGGFGMSATTEAIANFGQLYLQDGVWEGRRLLPEGWVAEASSFHSDNSGSGNANSDWQQGYGYQFWRCQHNAYRGDGAFGQFCVVMPEQDAVLAITSGLQDMQAVLNLVWQRLLPAFGAAALPADDRTHAALREKLGALALAVPQGAPSTALAEDVAERVYRFEPSQQRTETLSVRRGANEFNLQGLSLSRGAQGWTLTIYDGQGGHAIACGDGAWLEGRTDFLKIGGSQHIAAAGAWSDERTFRAKIFYDETPYCLQLTCRFADGELLVDPALNVSFGQTTIPQLRGRAS